MYKKFTIFNYYSTTNSNLIQVCWKFYTGLLILKSINDELNNLGAGEQSDRILSDQINDLILNMAKQKKADKKTVL